MAKQTQTPTEKLIASITKTIDLANELMENDRSKVLRLKGLVKQLEDIKRRII